MGYQHKKFFVSQVMISVATIGSLAYFFLYTGFFQEQEEIATADIRAYTSPRAPINQKAEHILSNQPTPNFSRKSPLSVSDVRQSLHNVALMQLSRPTHLNIPQTSYEWIAGLNPQEGHALISYLKRQPVESWKENLSKLQRLPVQTLRHHLQQRARDEDCLDGACFF